MWDYVIRSLSHILLHVSTTPSFSSHLSHHTQAKKAVTEQNMTPSFPRTMLQALMGLGL